MPKKYAKKPKTPKSTEYTKQQKEDLWTKVQTSKPEDWGLHQKKTILSNLQTDPE